MINYIRRSLSWLLQQLSSPDSDELIGEIRAAAAEAAENVRNWRGDEVMIQAIQARIPDFETSTTEQISNFCLWVQGEYLMPLVEPFFTGLYKVRKQITRLPVKEYIAVHLQSAVLHTQLVQVMSTGTQALIQAAIEHHDNPPEPEERLEEPPVEDLGISPYYLVTSGKGEA